MRKKQSFWLLLFSNSSPSHTWQSRWVGEPDSDRTDVMLMVVMMLAVDLHSRGKKDFDQRFEIRLSVIGMENDDDWLHFKQEQIHEVHTARC